MIISSHQWHDLWEAIKDDFLESTEKGIAVIFSLQEVETVCAVKMLLAGLKMQDVHYSTYPVDNYSELQSTLHALLDGSQEPRTVILINCGAGHFARDLQPSSACQVRFVVIDSHRPISPKYNDSSDVETVLVMDPDDPLKLENIPVADNIDKLGEEERQEIEDLARQEEEDEEEQDSQDGQPISTEWRERRRQLRLRDKLLSNYLDMGSSYGKPSPLVLQPLAEELVGKADLSVLWPCCIALTDQWLHQRVGTKHYESWYAVLRDRVKSEFPNPTMQDQQQQQKNNRMPSTSRIVADRDYRLMLHRHWSLYDSFAYSSYVAPRLQTWRQAGKENLQLLFAHMGIKLEHAKLPYGSMQERDHKAFRDKLQRAIVDSKSRLTYEGIACDGFALMHNLKATSASDVVHAVTALLTEHTLSEAHTAQNIAASSASFWQAAAAIDAHTTEGWKQLQRGIEMAKCMQQAIIQDGGLMVSDRAMIINPTAKIQELQLQNVPPTNAREFRHPLTLLRLAQFVRDANKVARLRPSSHPVLVVGPEDSTGWCLVIGLRGSVHQNEAQYNVFGRTIKEVLESPDSCAQWDDTREPFDSAVVYIQKGSVNNFMGEIRDKLAAAVKEAAAAKQQEEEQRQQQQQQQPARRRSREDAEDSRDSQRRRYSPPAAAAAAAGDVPIAAADAPDEEEYADSHLQQQDDIVAASDDVDDGDDV